MFHHNTNHCTLLPSRERDSPSRSPSVFRSPGRQFKKKNSTGATLTCRSIHPPHQRLFLCFTLIRNDSFCRLKALRRAQAPSIIENKFELHAMRLKQGIEQPYSYTNTNDTLSFGELVSPCTTFPYLDKM